MTSSSCGGYSMQELLDRNTGDPRTRLELGDEIMRALPLPGDSTVLNNFCDVMVQWLNGSNFKVALCALDIIDTAIGVSGKALAPYILENITTVMERLGDKKEPVRTQAHQLLLKLMKAPNCSPQLVIDKLVSGLTHKQFLVRTGVLLVLQDALRMFGAGAIQLSKIVPLVCKLISDANASTRDAAADTIVTMYVYTGDRLIRDVQKKRLVPDQKLVGK